MKKVNQKYLVLDGQYKDLFDSKLSKAQETQLLIFEAVTRCYAELGADSVTTNKIANVAGLSRTLIIHYFPQRLDLLLKTARYVRTNMQRLAVQHLEGKTDPAKILEAYVGSTFEWLKDFPSHARFWLFFYYYCGIDKNFLKLNSELVSMGRERIVNILELGFSNSGHKPPSKLTLHANATSIQSLITGNLLAALTEDTQQSMAISIKNTQRACATLTGWVF